MSQPTEKKRISISVKRQLTIPQKYYDALGFDKEAECLIKDGGLFIQPIKTESSNFSEEILADLVSQGFSGQDLLARFKDQSRKIRPAVQRLILEADEAAKTGTGKHSLADLFGPDAT